MMKVALVYDRINKWGGAERVLLALHKLFPDAPLYTSVYNPKTAPWASVFNIKTSFLQHFPFAPFSHESYAPLMPLAFESFSFDEYDVVISVTSEAAKGIITKPRTFHVSYCLTPTRYLWSEYAEYFKNPVLRTLAKPIVSYLRKWDLQSSYRPDIYIAISKEVQKRIKKYYGRESLLVYPPLTLCEQGAEFGTKNFFVPQLSSRSSSERLHQVRGARQDANEKNFCTSPRLNKVNLSSNSIGYFLVVSRLVPHKRVDIAIEACNKLNLSLKIIGIGKLERRLKNIAGPTIEFLGNLTDEELMSYYKGCSALLFTGNEDFGLVMVEARKLGKPVIAYRGGGALEIIQEGKTGVFFYPQNVEALMDVLKRFDKLSFDNESFINRSTLFAEKTFKEKFLKVVESGYKKYKTL